MNVLYQDGCKVYLCKLNIGSLFVNHYEKLFPAYGCMDMKMPGVSIPLFSIVMKYYIVLTVNNFLFTD